MNADSLFPRNFWAVLAILAAPAAAALAVFVVLGWVSWMAAGGAVFLVAITLGLLIRSHLRRLGQIALYLQRLAAESDDPGNVPPRLPDTALEALGPGGGEI
jgi:hypothetical protein